MRLRLARLRLALFADILRVGAVGSVSTFQTTLTVALTTALVGAAAGPDAVAGYGTGARLEYLLIPLVFGLGAPLVALVGTNIGAGQRQRALRAALIGGGVAFCLAEAVGVAAAIWPMAWLGLFGADPRMLETGAAYLRMVGPAYGFFGLGPVPLLRLAGCGPAALAAAGRAAADGAGGRRRLARPAADGLVDVGVRRARAWRWSSTAARCWPPSHQVRGSASAAKSIGQGQRIVWFGTTLPALVSRSTT